MSYLREGIEFYDTQIWGSGTFQLGSANGTWTPNGAISTDIVPTEVGERQAFTPSLSWNTNTNRNEITISLAFTPTADITFNRVFIIKDGSLQNSWTSTAAPATDTLTIPGQDFMLGDVFYLARLDIFITVINITVDDVQFNTAGTLLSGDVITDARGLFLAAIQFTNLNTFFNGVPISVEILGESLTTSTNG